MPSLIHTLDGPTEKVKAVRSFRRHIQTSTKLPYQYVAASQTALLLGATGAIGDQIHKLVFVVSVAANSQVQIRDSDGGADRVVFPANPGAGVCTYPLTLNFESAEGGWYITTGSGVTVWAVGSFT